MFVDGVAEKYPSELLQRRNIIEGLVIGSVYKQPDLYDDIRDVSAYDFLTEDAFFYFALGQQLSGLGYKSFDAVTIESYLSDKFDLKNGYDNRGGFRTLRELSNVIDTDNFESYVDELNKSNILIEMHSKGFNVLQNLEKFQKMTSEQLYQWFDYQLNNVFIKKSVGVKIEDLTIDREFLESCDKGDEMGASISSVFPLLNYLTCGVHKSNVAIIAGFSGSGKTSLLTYGWILPLLEQGHKICIIANEQNRKAWQKLILGTVAANKVHYYKSTRKKIQTGKFSGDDWDAYNKSQEWINQYKNSLKFVKLYDYSIDSVKKIIKKLSKEGFGYFIYDTFKTDNNASENVTGKLVEDSKQLLQTADKENVGVIITQQLALYMEDTRYLTASCLSNAKQVKEIVSELFLLRKLWTDEYTGQKHDVKAYKFIKDDNGKYTKSKEYLNLDADKKYMLLFLDKTRSDESDVCLIYEWQAQYNKWSELGWATPHRDRR